MGGTQQLGLIKPPPEPHCHHLPVQQPLLPGCQWLQMDAAPQRQLDEDATTQTRGQAVVPEGWVALQARGQAGSWGQEGRERSSLTLYAQHPAPAKNIFLLGASVTV